MDFDPGRQDPYLKAILIKTFHDVGAIRIAPAGQPFTLASGKTSNYYVDCRKVITTSRGAGLAAASVTRLLWPLLQHPEAKEESRVYLGTVGVGGALLMGAMLAFVEEVRLRWKGFVIRDQAKVHGLGNKLEGHIGEGHIFLIEDVITTGDSIGKTAGLVRELGFKLTGICALVDREEGGVQALQHELGIPVRAALTLSELAVKSYS